MLQLAYIVSELYILRAILYRIDELLTGGETSL